MLRTRLLHTLPALLLLLAALWTLGPAPASAQDLDQLRAQGLVGERFDGYAEAIDQSYLNFVKQVNGKRQQIYQQRAAQQNVPADQVGRVYAQEIMSKAPPGTRFLKEDGSWTSK